MSRLIPHTTTGKIAAALVLIALGLALSLTLVDRAYGAPYANPFWTNASPSQETALREVATLGFVQEVAAGGRTLAVDFRTGELFLDQFLFRTPGKVEDNSFSFCWRSFVSGSTQLGRSVLPSWETTAQYVVLLPSTPNAPNGHRVDIRRSTGRIDAFVWNGTAYTAPADVFDTLTAVGGGGMLLQTTSYILTDKHGDSLSFDMQGMPQTYTDRNGNTDSYSYNASMQLTGITDDRGQSYTVTPNSNGYIQSITDPAGRTWTFTYDSNDNLKTVTTPATQDQPSGITTTYGYTNNRISSVTDGRGNTVWSIAYDGSGRVDTITIDGDTVTYDYFTGRTERTDRNGNVHRYHFSGQQVTQTDMWVDSTPKYVKLYRYM